MNIDISAMQEINIHSIEKAKFDSVNKMSTESVKDRYYTTLTIRTEDNTLVEINLFTSNKKMLNKLTK